jgi:hypothetical protein
MEVGLASKLLNCIEVISSLSYSLLLEEVIYSIDNIVVFLSYFLKDLRLFIVKYTKSATILYRLL